MGRGDVNIRLAQLLEKGLNRHVGKKNAITTTDIIAKLRLKYAIKGLSGPKIREHIHYLRTVKKLPIVGDRHGYYMAENELELKHLIRSLKSRSKEITEACDSMIQVYHEMFNQATMNF